MNNKFELKLLAVVTISIVQMFFLLEVRAKKVKGLFQGNVFEIVSEDYNDLGINSQNDNWLSHDRHPPLQLQSEAIESEKTECLISIDADIFVEDDGDTPLHAAARDGNLDFCIYWVQKGLDIEAKNNQGETPLMVATKERSFIIFSYLIEISADIYTVDDNNNTLLHVMSKNWDNSWNEIFLKSLFRLLKDNCFFPLSKMIDKKNNDEETPIFNAIRSKNEKFSILLARNVESINLKNRKGQTSLMLAGKYGLKKLVKELIKLGANIEDTDNYGNTVLHYMAHDWDTSLNEIFINTDNVQYINKPFWKLREMINIKNNKGKTPLLISIESNQPDLACLLIKSGADVNVKDTKNEAPLHIAARVNSIKVAKLLIENGANIEDKDYFFQLTPLHEAVRTNHFEIVKLLIESGANVEAKNIYEETPLFIASVKNYFEIAKLLIKDNSEFIDTGDYLGRTPLHLAALEDNLEVAQLLVFNGANVNSRDCFGKVPLQYAAFGCIKTNISEKVVQLLIENNCDIEVKGCDGMPLIIQIIRQGCVDLARLLISKGADVNETYERDQGALYYAVRAGNVDLVALLLKSGARGPIDPEDLHRLFRKIKLKQIPEFEEFLYLENGSICD